jgi:hypothetical protein
MTDTPPNFADQDPVRKRRSLTAAEQVDTVTFTRKGLSPERLEALKQFLKFAKADEIASVRKLYGDNPEVLEMIGLEILPSTNEKVVEESQT